MDQDTGAPIGLDGLPASVTVFFTVVESPYGPKRVGKPYGSRKAAREWVPFVRAAWRGCRVSVRQLTVRYDGEGEIDETTKRRLDREFNMAPPPARGRASAKIAPTPPPQSGTAKLSAPPRPKPWDGNVPDDYGSFGRMFAQILRRMAANGAVEWSGELEAHGKRYVVSVSPCKGPR